MGQAAHRMFEEIRALRPQERRELLRLLTAEDTEESDLWTAVSESSFADLWDNEYDAIHDALPPR
ncbi:MAG: hypothetical protein HY814_04345 [Candidatus Riflebacteria bacterium]|nr:hypothetical protein [Candidatus Riflebacteria bacterium]